MPALLPLTVASIVGGVTSTTAAPITTVAPITTAAPAAITHIWDQSSFAILNTYAGEDKYVAFEVSASPPSEPAGTPAGVWWNALHGHSASAAPIKFVAVSGESETYRLKADWRQVEYNHWLTVDATNEGYVSTSAALEEASALEVKFVPYDPYVHVNHTTASSGTFFMQVKRAGVVSDQYISYCDTSCNNEKWLRTYTDVRDAMPVEMMMPLASNLPPTASPTAAPTSPTPAPATTEAPLEAPAFVQAYCRCDPRVHFSHYTTCQVSTNNVVTVTHGHHKSCHPLQADYFTCAQDNWAMNAQHHCAVVDKQTDECQCCSCGVPCSPGFHQDADTSGCEACAAGQFSDQLSAPGCTMCPSGKFNVMPVFNYTYEQEQFKSNQQSVDDNYASMSGGGILDALSPLEMADYVPGSTHEFLKSLREHHQLDNLLVDCQFCPPHTWTEDEAGRTECVPTATGFPTGAPTPYPTVFPTALPTAHPTNAPTMTTTDSPTAAPTAAPTPACIAGEYRTNTTCTLCAVGTASTMVNAVDCTACAAGKYAVQGSAKCTDCAIGQYHVSTGGACVDCETGKYTEWEGGTNCYHCPTGKYQDKEAYHVCHECDAGKWTADLEGQSACSAIPTAAPTDFPTATPTKAPTEAPTEWPTQFPTAQPTDHPTTVPTAFPTAAPTSAPTAYPTAVPTEAPTDYPTAAPTEAPTAFPTAFPTAAPTDAPTDSPTYASLPYKFWRVRNLAPTPLRPDVSEVTFYTDATTTVAPLKVIAGPGPGYDVYHGTNAELGPANAIDGDVHTFWHPYIAEGTALASHGAWIGAEFASPIALVKVTAVGFGIGMTGSPYAWDGGLQLQVSNDETVWYTVGEEPNSDTVEYQHIGDIVTHAPTQFPTPIVHTGKAEWTYDHCVDASVAGTLVKTCSEDSWHNAGAISKHEIAQSSSIYAGQGIVWSVPVSTGSNAIAGLGNGDTSQGLADVEYGLICDPTQGVVVWEGGVEIGVKSNSCLDGDRLEVRVTGHVGVGAGVVVSYLKNGDHLWDSEKSATFPLNADTSIFHGQINDVVVYTTVRLTPWISWIALDGVSVTSNSITRTKPGSQWNAGAISSRQIHRHDYVPQGVKFSCPDSTRHAMGGLANGNDDATYVDIDYGLFCVGGSTRMIYVFEKGLNEHLHSETYTAADELEVSVDGTTVSYKMNGNTFFTSPKVAQFPLVVDTSIFNFGDSLANVAFATVSQAIHIYPTGAPTTQPTDLPTKAPTKAPTGDGYYAQTALNTVTDPYFGATIQTVQSSEASAKAQCDANSACRGLFLTGSDPETYDLVASGELPHTVQCIELDKDNAGQCLTAGPVYTKIIACATNPCQHGTCADVVSGFQCACELGYSNHDCGHNINDCSNPNPCLNGGTCTDGVNSFTCACVSAWNGATCNDAVLVTVQEAINTNGCETPGTAQMSQTECGDAAAAVSKPFSGSQVIDSQSYPGGCFMWGATPNFYFNSNVGNPTDAPMNASPLCKRMYCDANSCAHMAGSASVSAATCTDTPLGPTCACKAGTSGTDCSELHADHSTINFVRLVGSINECPAGTSKITTHSGCNIASTQLTDPVVQETPVVNSDLYPGGCFGTALGSTAHVYFNQHATGSAVASYSPVCVDSHVPGMQ